jgi:exodeoxyribonuclease VII small subunit
MTDKKVSIEQSIEKLQQIVAYFDQEDFDLDEGMKRYDEAIGLVTDVSDKIRGYRQQITDKRAALEAALNNLEEL